jgi:Protein of unknown function (DUF551)
MSDTPVCPKCAKPLQAVTQGENSMLNSYQFDAVRAGDWFCECHNNGRGNSEFAYFWNREVMPVQPSPLPPVQGGEGEERQPNVWVKTSSPVQGEDTPTKRYEKALAMVHSLCVAERDWIMSIPARPEHDPDLVIADSLKDIPELIEKLAAAERSLASARQQIVELGQQLEHDRSSICDGIKGVKEAIDGSYWLTEGRGPYEWNDDRWHEEFYAAAEEILAALAPLQKVAADWTNCPKSGEEIAQARIDLKAELASAREEKERISKIQADGGGWRCYHCGELFIDAEAARDHFGSDEFETGQEPGCISPLRGDEKAQIKAVRDAEEYARQCQAESAENDEAEGLLESYRADLRRYFGDDCSSIWIAFDRYSNMKFDHDQQKQRAERLESELAALRLQMEDMQVVNTTRQAEYLKALADLAEMTTDRDLWRDQHNGDCPNAAELEEARKMEQWIPVEDGLTDVDGKSCLVWCPDIQCIFTACLRNSKWQYFGGYGEIAREVSHWRPLPQPPSSQPQGEKEGK